MSIRTRIERLEKTIPKPMAEEWPPDYRTPMNAFSSRIEALQDLIAFCERAMADPRATADQRASWQRVIDLIFPKVQRELQRDREREMERTRREETTFN